MTGDRCPVCGERLVIGGEGSDAGATRYYWCLRCNAARDPAAAIEGQVALGQARGQREGG